MPQHHIDPLYAKHNMGSSCMPYTPHSVKLKGDNVEVKYFLTNVGDVLRRVFLCQPDPFVDKSQVQITVECSGVKVVDKMSWALWVASQGTHDMCNELLFLDSAKHHVKWPMHALQQDCMCVTLCMPQSIWDPSSSPRDLRGWFIIATWDLMDPEWRKSNSHDHTLLELHVPTKNYFNVSDGQLHNARDSLNPQHIKVRKRRSNPFY